MIGTTIFAGTNNGAFRSTDSGKSWIDANTGLQGTGISVLGVSGANLFASGEGRVFLSTDNGVSWTRADSGFPGFQVYALAGKGTDIFAGCADGVYRSTNNGANWSATGLLNPGNNPIIFDALDLVGPNLFAGSYEDGSISLSTDGGSDWSTVNNGFTDDTWVVSLFNVGTNLFAGSNGSVLFSTDNGAKWTPELAGWPSNTFANAFAAIGTDPSSATLFVGTQSGNYATYGTGVWKRAISDMVSAGVSSEPQTVSYQIQSYPNPFTQSTTISFTSPESGASIADDAAEVSIVNLLGSQVARLFEGELAAGEHTFTWNAANMPPGAYWAIVRMNGASQQIPIVLQP